jgi:alanine dehydrogenase
MSTLGIGVPSEITDNGKRVALTPDGVVELAHGGREVLVEAGAGEGSRFSDDEYAAAGAKIVPTADDVFAAADLIAELLATP